MNKPAVQPVDVGPQLQPGDERRRSQRVMIRIAVTLEMLVGGKKSTLHAVTTSVNNHGAMIHCDNNLPVDTLFELINNRTEQRQICRVTRSAVENQGGYLVPVEFAEPTPGFWHISFPPPGWKGVEN